MTSKTPSSLKWLLDKRSRLAGSLEECAVELASMEAKHSLLLAEQARLQQLLFAVDQTIGLHEIKVNPNLLLDIRNKQPALFGHGKITKIVLAFLRSEPDRWVTTGEMMTLVCTGAHVKQLSLDQNYLRRLIRRRLQGMSRSGLIDRSGCEGHAEQRWLLLPIES